MCSEWSAQGKERKVSVGFKPDVYGRKIMIKSRDSKKRNEKVKLNRSRMEIEERREREKEKQ